MMLRNLFKTEPKPQDILNQYAISVLERVFLRWPNVSPEELMDAHERVGVPSPDPAMLTVDKHLMMIELLTLVILKAYPSTPAYMAETAAKNGVSLWRQ